MHFNFNFRLNIYHNVTVFHFTTFIYNFFFLRKLAKQGHIQKIIKIAKQRVYSTKLFQFCEQKKMSTINFSQVMVGWLFLLLYTYSIIVFIIKLTMHRLCVYIYMNMKLKTYVICIPTNILYTHISYTIARILWNIISISLFTTFNAMLRYHFDITKTKQKAKHTKNTLFLKTKKYKKNFFYKIYSYRSFSWLEICHHYY